MLSKIQLPLLTVAIVAITALVAVSAGAQVERVEELEFPPLPEFQVPEPTRVELDNGMVVMLLEDDELPLVEAIAMVRTGSRLEPADKIGLASLTGSVLRSGGTASLAPDELDELLESRAARIESSIGTTSGQVTMSSLREDFPEILGVFADVLRRPRFAEERLRVARNQVNSGIARQNDNPMQILFREHRKILYGEDSPYARSETYETVGNIDRDDLVAWHREHFHPDRVVLGLVGDFETDEALALVREAFGDWPRGPEPPEVEAGYDREPRPGVYYVRKDDMTQSNIAMGHLGIRRDNPDYYAVEVMNHVLSGSFASRLFSNVRSRKGLAYSVRGSVGSAWDYEGLTTLWMTTRTETTGAGIEALLEEARDMTAAPPTEEEVARAKRSILESFVFTSDSRRKILNQQLTYELHGYPLDWLARYRDGIEAVTVEEVRRAAERYIHPDRFAILVVGPAEGRDRPLSEFGEVAEVDITIPEPPAERVEATPEGEARARELLTRAAEAHGGAALDGLSALRVESRTVRQLPQGGDIEIAATTLILPPDHLRQQATLPFGQITSVLTPEAAFVDGPQGLRPLPDSQQAQMREGLAREPVVLLRGRDAAGAVSEGAGELAGLSVELVTVQVDGATTTLGLDPDSGRLVAMRFRGRDALTGTPGEEVRLYSDFREEGGVVLPFRLEVHFDGEPVAMTTIERIELDPEVPEGAFAPPEGL